MSCIHHRLKKIAAIAGPERIQQIDDILMTEPRVARALLEGTCPSRVADALVRVCAAIDMESEGHARRLAAGCRMLGAAAGLGDEELAELELGARVHDIGKLSVPDAVLQSASSLTPSDLDHIRMHCSLGHAVLFGIHGYMRAAELVLHHHEYWDGTGYSEGRRGDDIPVFARIFGVVDSYEAIVRGDRRFRVATPQADARDEIIGLAGERYDPAVVAVFARVDRAAWEDVFAA